jgi:hypothetical protein
MSVISDDYISDLSDDFISDLSDDYISDLSDDYISEGFRKRRLSPARRPSPPSPHRMTIASAARCVTTIIRRRSDRSARQDPRRAIALVWAKVWINKYACQARSTEHLIISHH